MKVLKKISIVFILLSFQYYFGQRHLNGEYSGPVDLSMGLKYIVVGGVTWGIGMLIGLALRKNERGTIEDGQNFLTSIVGILCVGGAILFFFGLIFMGLG